MKVLWVATKPPWPPVDGGRLVTLTTLEALRDRGVEVELVAPCDAADVASDRAGDRGGFAESPSAPCRVHLVPVARSSLPAAALASLRDRVPLTIARHAHDAVRARVAEILGGGSFDVVHAEQLHALAACAPARVHRVPVVLRCQNVESDLWRDAGRTRPALRALAAIEAVRLARYEGGALREVATAVALTAPDAARLASLAGAGITVNHIAAPFPAELPAGAPLHVGDDGESPPRAGGGSAGLLLPGSDRASGAPSERCDVVVPASAGWGPNDDGHAWLRDELWPRVRTALPHARLHVFGAPTGSDPARGIVNHRVPADSRDAFPAGAIVVVPLRYATGVRMRILEAWARGLPVIATPAAARGLDVSAGRELLLASNGDELIAALRRLDDPATRAALVAAGREVLRRDHDPARVAERLESIYRAAR